MYMMYITMLWWTLCVCSMHFWGCWLLKAAVWLWDGERKMVCVTLATHY